MNNKERFMNALALKAVDRPPVAAVVTAVTVPMMEKVGIDWPAAHHDPQLLADLAAAVWTVSEIECIKLPFGMTVEVEAFGCPIDFGTRDTLPTETGHIFNHPDELKIPDDFFERGRVPTVLAAIARLSAQYKEEVAVVSSIVGPFAIAAKLFGFDNLFPWIITNPAYVHQIMETLTPLAIAYANAQVEAGADAILLGEATCSGDLISPETYRDFVLPYHQQLCTGIDAPTILHICGNSTGHLPYIAETGTDAYSFDEGLDIAEARRHLKGKVALAGYVPMVEVFLQGTPEMVTQASLECLAQEVDILAPGCSMPQHTSLENIAAMIRAAKAWPAQDMVPATAPELIADLRASRANDGNGDGERKQRRRGRRRKRRRRASRGEE